MNRDELREALTEACWQMADAPYTLLAATLIDGPLAGLLAERDQALATLQAVREVVLDHDYPAGAIYDLRSILDAADGGDRDE